MKRTINGAILAHPVHDGLTHLFRGRQRSVLQACAHFRVFWWLLVTYV